MAVTFPSIHLRTDSVCVWETRTAHCLGIWGANGCQRRHGKSDFFTPIVGKRESNPSRTHDTGKEGDRENLTRGPLQVPFIYHGPIITPTSVHNVYPGLARGRNHRSCSFTVMIHGHVGVDVCHIYDALVFLSAPFIDPASEKAREVTP